MTFGRSFRRAGRKKKWMITVNKYARFPSNASKYHTTANLVLAFMENVFCKHLSHSKPPNFIKIWSTAVCQCMNKTVSNFVMDSFIYARMSNTQAKWMISSPQKNLFDIMFTLKDSAWNAPSKANNSYGRREGSTEFPGFELIFAIPYDIFPEWCKERVKKEQI